jgi:hypothetical protein
MNKENIQVSPILVSYAATAGACVASFAACLLARLPLASIPTLPGLALGMGHCRPLPLPAAMTDRKTA